MKVKVDTSLSQDILQKLLRYCPETGHFFWKANKRGHTKAGQLAGRIANDGYQQICVNGRLHLAHRLAWLHVYGHWPVNYLDHINGIKDDNRINNLREVTQTENMQNIRTAYASNKSCGLLGASWNSYNSKWKASIRHSGKKHHIGYYDTAEEAHQAYLQKKIELHAHSEL